MIKRVLVAGAVLAVIMAIAIFISCTDKTNNPIPSPPVSGLRIHEWGVLVGCESDTAHFLTSRPKIVSTVREPVIYIHSDSATALDVNVTFAAGTPTLTYPEADVSTRTVKWESVNFADELKKTMPTDTSDHVPLRDIRRILNNVDADCLEYNGETTRFLFYEGIVPFENRISVRFNSDSTQMTFTNNGPYPVYNVVFVDTTFYYRGIVEQLNPYDSTAVDVPGLIGRHFLADDLVSIGFTNLEAGAFEILWRESLLHPREYENPIPGLEGNLFYRLSQREYNDMLRLEVAPEPEEVIRALYVLIHIR